MWLILSFLLVFSYLMLRFLLVDRWEIINLELCLNYLDEKFRHQSTDYIKSYNIEITRLKKIISEMNSSNLFRVTNLFIPLKVPQVYLENENFFRIHNDYLLLFKKRRKFFLFMILSVIVYLIAFLILKIYSGNSFSLMFQ